MKIRYFFYNCLIHACAPFICGYLWARSVRGHSTYRLHLRERFGYYPPVAHLGSPVWVHAASMGELHSVQGLIEAIRSEYTSVPWVISCATPTGRSRAQDLFGQFATIVYVPFDTRGSVQRFFNTFHPCLALIVDTELWPNLLAVAKKNVAAVVLVNARLSWRSFRMCACFSIFFKHILSAFTVVLAKSQQDADFFAQLGVSPSRLLVTGNLKFDIPVDPYLVQQGLSWRAALPGRFILLLASTHSEEEEALLHAFSTSGAWTKNVLLVVVPRHPRKDIALLLNHYHLSFSMRSSGYLPNDQSRVWVGDSVGEMAAYYALAHVAIVGGSLQAVGGHNLIEACAVGVPVIVGPYTFNFAQETEYAIAAGAAQRAVDARDALQKAYILFSDPSAREHMHQQALHFVRQHQGIQERALTVLRPIMQRCIPSTPPKPL